jgi:NTP pyrophosphatase (non-canonical NTP hydrolase)
VSSKTLDEMQAEVYVNNKAHGWFDEERSVGDDIAHLHAEVSEMWEAFRVTGLSDATGGKMTATDMPNEFVMKPEGFGSEVADVFIRLLDTCERRGIDLQFEYERKMAYNRTRPYKHGKNL